MAAEYYCDGIAVRSTHFSRHNQEKARATGRTQEGQLRRGRSHDAPIGRHVPVKSTIVDTDATKDDYRYRQSKFYHGPYQRVSIAHFDTIAGRPFEL